MRRRLFLQSIVSSGTWALLPPQVRPAAAARRTGEPNVRFLNGLREKIHLWIESLWDPTKVGFRQNDKIGVNLMSTTDVAWMRYAVNDLDTGGDHRDAWVRSF